MRIKEENLKEWVGNLCTTLGKQYGYEHGNWHLEHRPSQYGGGYRIAERCGVGGATYPFGYGCMKGEQLRDSIMMTLQAIKMYQDPNHESSWAWPREMAGGR